MKPTQGQKVKFGRPNGEKTLGEVVKVNRTRAKVKQLEQRGTYKNHPVGTVWTVPFSLIDSADEPKALRSDDEILAELRQVECGLSPENLFCDGERPVAQARSIERRLNRQRAQLICALGREPSMEELYPSLRRRA